MAITQKRLFGPVVAVTTSTDTTAGRYLVPSLTTTIVKQIIICNTAASAATVSVGVGGVTAAVSILSSMAVGANETMTVNLSLVLAAAEKLFMTASATTVTFTVVGIEET